MAGKRRGGKKIAKFSKKMQKETCSAVCNNSTTFVGINCKIDVY